MRTTQCTCTILPEHIHLLASASNCIFCLEMPKASKRFRVSTRARIIRFQYRYTGLHSPSRAYCSLLPDFNHIHVSSLIAPSSEMFNRKENGKRLQKNYTIFELYAGPCLSSDFTVLFRLLFPFFIGASCTRYLHIEVVYSFWQEASAQYMTNSTRFRCVHSIYLPSITV